MAGPGLPSCPLLIQWQDDNLQCNCCYLGWILLFSHDRVASGRALSLCGSGDNKTSDSTNPKHAGHLAGQCHGRRTESVVCLAWFIWNLGGFLTANKVYCINITATLQTSVGAPHRGTPDTTTLKAKEKGITKELFLPILPQGCSRTGAVSTLNHAEVQGNDNNSQATLQFSLLQTPASRKRQFHSRGSLANTSGVTFDVSKATYQRPGQGWRRAAAPSARLGTHRGVEGSPSAGPAAGRCTIARTQHGRPRTRLQPRQRRSQTPWGYPAGRASSPPAQR